MQLGVAGAVALGLSVVHTTMKVILPSKAAVPLISGAWFLGGDFIIFRVTASTAAGWAAMTQRNDRRKRLLQTRLAALQEHITAMNAAARGEAPPSASQSPHPTAPPTAERTAEAIAAGIPRPSPTGSTGSSIELVEAPAEEESGSAALPGGGNRGSKGEESAASASGSSRKVGGRTSLESWKQYASLGGRKSE